MKKINCGGFYINEDNFEITDDGELKLKSGGSSSDNGAWVLGVYDVSINNTTITTQSGIRSFANDEIDVHEYFTDRRDFNDDKYSWVSIVIPSQSLTLPGAVSQVDVYFDDIDAILDTMGVSVSFVKLTTNASFTINGSVTVIFIAYPVPVIN